MAGSKLEPVKNKDKGIIKLMPITIDVSIWGWEGIGGLAGWGRVGHAMISDSATNTALLSQFPHRFGGTPVPKGPNILIPFGQTYTEEGGKPDVIYEVTIGDGFIRNFQLMVQTQINRPTWDWDPTPPSETHCARAAYEALRSGGMPIDPEGEYTISDGSTNEILPNSLWHLMEKAGFVPLMQRAPNLGIESIKDNEKVVSFSRQQNLWTK